MPAAGPFIIEFYEDATGHKPVLDWIRQELSVRRRRALGYALYRLLQRYGVGICETEFGRQLGGGLFEFRLRLSERTDGERAILRVFCHATGDRVILLLGAYGKGLDPTRRRQEIEIRTVVAGSPTISPGSDTWRCPCCVRKSGGMAGYDLNVIDGGWCGGSDDRLR